jgi:hypothetical protein
MVIANTTYYESLVFSNPVVREDVLMLTGWFMPGLGFEHNRALVPWQNKSEHSFFRY